MDRPLAARTSASRPLDLVQLHCPPTEVFSDDAVFDALDTLVAEQRIAAYGVSVETCDEALTAIARPGVATVQIILNAFRLKPLEQVLPAAARPASASSRGCRWPRACCRAGTTTTPSSPSDDHRTYNRHGEAFDVGETFSGVDFDTGVRAAVDRLGALVPEGVTPAQFALRWVIDQPGVTRGDPRRPQRRAGAGQRRRRRRCPPLDDGDPRRSRDLYDELIRPQVHDRW